MQLTTLKRMMSRMAEQRNKVAKSGGAKLKVFLFSFSLPYLLTPFELFCFLYLQACDAWKKEAEESKLLMGKVEADKMMALQQRDEAAGRCASLLQELERVGVTNQHMKCLQRHEELESLPVQQVL